MRHLRDKKPRDKIVKVRQEVRRKGGESITNTILREMVLPVLPRTSKIFARDYRQRSVYRFYDKPAWAGRR